MLFLITSCNLNNVDDPAEDTQVGIRVQNALMHDIEGLKMVVSNGVEEKELNFGNLEHSGTSEYQFVEDLEYYHFGDKDYSFIISAYFLIDTKGYGESNCFCDPKFSKNLLDNGKFTMIIGELIEARNTFYYSIEKD